MNRMRMIALLLTLSIVPAVASNAAAQITVDIGPGLCSPPAADISGPCPAANPKITIAPYAPSSGPARVEIGGSDTSVDSLSMRNTKITANQAIQNFHIVFSRDHTPGPNDPPADVWYWTKATGGMSAISGNKMTSTSSVATRDMGGVTHECNPSCSAVFSKYDASQWTNPPDLTSNRVLKNDLMITLASGNILYFTTGLRTENGPPPDKVFTEDSPDGKKDKEPKGKKRGTK